MAKNKQNQKPAETKATAQVGNTETDKTTDTDKSTVSTAKLDPVKDPVIVSGTDKPDVGSDKVEKDPASLETKPDADLEDPELLNQKGSEDLNDMVLQGQERLNKELDGAVEELEDEDGEMPKVIQVGGRRMLTSFNNHIPATAAAKPSLAEALNSFVCEMAPNSGANSKQMTQAQVRLFHNLIDFFNNTKENLREIHGEIIKVIDAFQDKAFSIPHMNKNMEAVALTDKQIRLFQALLHVYRMAAVHGKQRAVAEVDLPLIVKYYVDAYPKHTTGHEMLPELFREG